VPTSVPAVAIGGVAVLIIGVVMRLAEHGLRQRALPRGFSSPVVAMQMARSMQEVGQIVGDPDHEARFRMRTLQYVDFLFVCAYWLESVMIGGLLWQYGSPLTKPLGAAAILCATLTAFFDFRENLAILRVLSTSATQKQDRLVRAVNAAAVRKWYLFSITTVLLSIAFVGIGDYRTVAGLLLLLTGTAFFVTGMVGLIGSWRRDATLEWTAMPMGLGLVLVVVTFW
jgi:hypothetical protein